MRRVSRCVCTKIMCMCVHVNVCELLDDHQHLRLIIKEHTEGTLPMHKLSRGKTVLIYAMAKRGTQTRTDAAVFYTWLIFSINVCIVYNMYTEDNANSSPKNNTPVGLCIIFFPFRFVCFFSSRLARPPPCSYTAADI